MAIPPSFSLPSKDPPAEHLDHLVGTNTTEHELGAPGVAPLPCWKEGLNWSEGVMWWRWQ